MSKFLCPLLFVLIAKAYALPAQARGNPRSPGGLDPSSFIDNISAGGSPLDVLHGMGGDGGSPLGILQGLGGGDIMGQLQPLLGQLGGGGLPDIGNLMGGGGVPDIGSLMGGLTGNNGGGLPFNFGDILK